MNSNENCPLITVFTCVYNGGRTIHRVFRSMRAQTYRNLEHIIVDDGSTDFDIVRPLLDEYIASVPFNVKVFHKTNGGKHTATNVALDNATGEFVIKLDADDELTPHCIAYLVKKWFEIPENERQAYWCVHGRCEDQIKHELIGELYKEGINELSVSDQNKEILATKGEKTGLMLRKVLDQFRYPEPEGVRFVTEEVVWLQIRHQGKFGVQTKLLESITLMKVLLWRIR